MIAFHQDDLNGEDQTGLTATVGQPSVPGDGLAQDATILQGMEPWMILIMVLASLVAMGGAL